ncbi:acyclic terpene utilization AtuA family protein [Conexibacter sp. JD483]|uniref:acyclic terpene utilization AtuA family protein n=1 Tax=unclassified Conexibacter TaxID=2627773 RepID=UPI00272458F0|nr:MULTISPECIES: acyclic terpene utilization AtuA family protein [unclassified Conexibacter]MDO8187820.1 acyclic terpene utilization AtuA family protein [Conexibacter sp. CPCC 205706]MDO8199971.1 acyclic terpene utilization AtuA family protein [Conexibacter sp. CPCC 205762]MDR9369498.1 acyclic terpene utilization AtuA family protein [Conexibacter sp. JD483]
MRETVRLGCWAAFWGDTSAAVDQLLDGADVDYLVADYLSEITMALLARARAKDPEAGYVPDAVRVLAPRLAEIKARGIRIVTNAGALNPSACAHAFREAAAAAGVELRVAAVEGDDLSPRGEELLAGAARDMFTGEPLPGRPMTINAYLGARPIAAALDAGADVVVTGRAVDSAVVLGPLMHEFGWADDDYDLLSAGTLAGHVVECGPQCTGGNFTDWDEVPGWDEMGFPVIEVRADGSAVVSKPANTGGLVSPATVGEQIVYEIGDPGAYVMPDVVCDWREVTLEQVGIDRVRVAGARGSRPPATYKVTATHADGFRVMATAMFSGLDAAGKARRAGQALVARTERLIAAAGHGPLTETSVEVIGAGDTHGPDHRDDSATEAVVKIAARHPEKAALEQFALEYAPMALVAQGMTGFFGGRPRPAPAISVYHLLLDKASTPVRVQLDDDEPFAVAIAAGDPELQIGTPALRDGDARLSLTDGGVTVPLRRLAWARSGDKGDQANIGVIARRPEFLAPIREQLTCARVGDRFAQYLTGGVRRWELPGLHALNFVLDGALGGKGGTSTLRFDPQGKSFAAMLLELPIAVPAEWDRDGRLTRGAAAAPARAAR